MPRTSNGLFLQVLTAVPVFGVPLEVTVYDGAHPATMLAELQGAREVSFQDLRSDIGSGSFKLARDDPKATTANIREGNLVKLKLHGIDQVAFWIEGPTLIVAESGASEWQIAGRSALAYLGRAVVYPPGWPAATGTSRTFASATAGLILTTLLAEAQARGAIGAITWDFDATADSLHDPWPTDLSLSIQAGASMLDVAKQLVALGIDVEVTPALVLRAYAPGVFGRHSEATVIWRSGRHIAGQVERVGNRTALTNAVLVAGAGAKYLEVNDPTSQADPYTGRREGTLSFAGSADPTQLSNAGTAQIALTEADAQAISVPLNHGPATGGLYEPYIDYRPGDWITLDVPGQYDLEAFQIEGLTVAQTAGGDYTVTADVNAIATDYLVRLQRMLSSLAGTSSGASGSAAGGLGYGAPPSSGNASDTVVGPDAFGSSPSPGTAPTLSRGDHDHGLPGVVDGGAP